MGQEDEKPRVHLPVLNKRQIRGGVQRGDWKTFRNKTPLTLGERFFRDKAARIHAQYERPKTREDCRDMPRPCPWAGCRHHLAINVTETGTLQVMSNWDDGRPTCSLDEAERGGMILEDLGDVFHVTRERVRQIELVALHEIRRRGVDLEEPPEQPDYFETVV